MSVTEHFALLPILFSIAVLLWVGGFDIIYALQDKDFDSEQKLFSIPTYFGLKNAIIISTIIHVFSAAIILYAGYYGSFGILYCIGSLVFISLLVYQHLLVKSNDLSKINLAFFTLNGIASVVFAAFVIGDLVLNIRF